MKKKYFLILIVLSFFSCHKEPPKPIPSPEVDVYVAGYVSDDVNHPYPYPFSNSESGEHPTYWKNGSPVQLDFDRFENDGNSGRANAIALSGNNVYVAGFGRVAPDGYNPNPTVGPYAVLWENGIPWDQLTLFFYAPGQLSSIAVANNDVYLAALSPSKPSYLKNKDFTEFTDDYRAGGTTSIVVSGNDVYVAGFQQERKFVAKYWKNGNPVSLSDGTKDTYATSIAVSATDVYVAGSDIAYVSFGLVPHVDVKGVAKYWKNGTLVNLTNGSTGAYASSVAISGTDVYVAGTQWDGNAIEYDDGYTVYRRNPIAKYWKNGNPVNLTDGSKWAEARSIALSGNDVYVAGFEDGVAKYWKNGTPVILGDTSKYSEAYSIFLAPK